MTIYNGLIGLFWLVFIFIWIVTSFSAKKTISKTTTSNAASWIGWRILVVILAYFFVRSHLYAYIVPYDRMIEGNPTIHFLGVVLCGVGVLLAIWARLYLGRNWGMPMSVKENPELVTTGPYRFVRHPIYTGILLAIIGSVLASSVLWLLWLAFCSYYFYTSAQKEEKLMQKEFPDTYPAYKKRTKMLVPFLY